MPSRLNGANLKERKRTLELGTASVRTRPIAAIIQYTSNDTFERLFVLRGQLGQGEDWIEDEAEGERADPTPIAILNGIDSNAIITMDLN